MDPVGLRQFKIPIQKIAPVQVYKNRFDQNRFYRYYPSWSERLLILYHGSVGDSRYLCSLASALAEKKIANVLTPDLKDHGMDRHELAQVQSPQDLLWDLQDLLSHVHRKYPQLEHSIGGHSLGGALALKALCDPTLQMYFKNAVLVCPHLEMSWLQGAPETLGWFRPAENQNEFQVDIPQSFQSGTEVLRYQRSFFEAASLSSIQDLERLSPALRAWGFISDGDALFPAGQYLQLPAIPGLSWFEIPQVSHMGLVMDPRAIHEILSVLQGEWG